MKKIIIAVVLAGSKLQYDFFIKNNDLKPCDYPLLKNLSHLNRLRKYPVIKVGTYYMHPLYKYIKGI